MRQLKLYLNHYNPYKRFKGSSRKGPSRYTLRCTHKKAMFTLIEYGSFNHKYRPAQYRSAPDWEEYVFLKRFISSLMDDTVISTDRFFMRKQGMHIGSDCVEIDVFM
jgi:hypothetical protein